MAFRLPCDVLSAAQPPCSPQGLPESCGQSDVEFSSGRALSLSFPGCALELTPFPWVLQALQPGRIPAPAPAPGVHGEAALPARLRHPLPVPHVRALRRPPLQEPRHPRQYSQHFKEFQSKWHHSAAGICLRCCCFCLFFFFLEEKQIMWRWSPVKLG